MGAWGAGNWQNDDALDWAPDLTTPGAVEQALRAVVDAPAGLADAPTCCRALAAAEVVAIRNGHPSQDVPGNVQASPHADVTPSTPALLALARQAVQAIETDSELKNLFDVEGSVDAWLEVIRDLQARLSASS
jgi:hypothetical protein